MSRKVINTLILAAIVILTATGAAFKEESIKVEVSQTEGVKQGQTLTITVTSPKKLEDPVFYYKDRRYKIFKTGKNEYTGLLGINILEEAGEHYITLSDETGKLDDKVDINVVSTEYPIQNLVLNSKMSGLTASTHELNRISKAKHTITEKSMRTLPPYDSPCNGCINSVFGLKRYYNGEFSGNYHKGIDIRAPEGEPVRTITDGKVIIAEDFRLHGTAVAIDHGHGVMSIYIHLSKIDVNIGDHVKAGQKIGEVGMTGFATGPHLHWGLYINGTPVDPMKGWIKPVSLCK